jgi:hypothetical protein
MGSFQAFSGLSGTAQSQQPMSEHAAVARLCHTIRS